MRRKVEMEEPFSSTRSTAGLVLPDWMSLSWRTMVGHRWSRLTNLSGGLYHAETGRLMNDATANRRKKAFHDQ